MELDKKLNADEYKLKIEVDEDEDQLYNRLKQLKEHLEKIREEEKVLLKYLKFYQMIKGAIENIKKLLNSKYP